MTQPDALLGLTGKTALITGGGTGLGRHFAQELAGAGARVVLSARRIDKITSTAEEIVAQGGAAEAHPMDVNDPNSIIAALDAAGTVDIVVNNAGVSYPSSLLGVSVDDWDATMATNVRGALLVARESAKRISRGGRRGTIINVASILGASTQPLTGSYAASKAALIHLTRSMAREWAPMGIRVNALAPGYFATDIVDGFLSSEAGRALEARVPLGRFGELADLSGSILFLASDASAYVTGTVLTVDGGHSIPAVD